MAIGVNLKDMQNAIKRKAEIDDASLNYLAEQAVSIGLGVRWTKSQIMNVIDDLMFDNPTTEMFTVKLSVSKEELESCPVIRKNCLCFISVV